MSMQTKRDNFEYLWVAIFVILAILGCILASIYYVFWSPKTDARVYVDIQTKEVFERHKKSRTCNLSKYYNIIYTESPDEADLVLTTDFSKIDSSREYEEIGFTPLMFVMNKSEGIKQLNGFTVSEDETIQCKFTNLVDAVIEGKTWKALGGNDEKIMIHCPKLDSDDGILFKNFIIKSYQEIGTSDDVITEKVNRFFKSSNVVQLQNCITKLEKSRYAIKSNEMYVVLENEITKSLYNGELKKDICFVYPSKTIVRTVYSQINTDKNNSTIYALYYYDEEHGDSEKYFYSISSAYRSPKGEIKKAGYECGFIWEGDYVYKYLETIDYFEEE